jgi:site-specific DNA-methyltransferase (adenine-specific)
MNRLYLGDCLNVLRTEIPDESVDLIYIDPPFNSKRDYYIFFDSKEIHTQRVAFEDTWTLINIQDSMGELHTLQHDKLYALLKVYQDVAPHAFPYLVMMSLRILELHRVLKPTGSFYLHCDPTMSHYLKTACDLIFEPQHQQNEIVWKRTSAHTGSKRWGPVHDVILFYSKSDHFVWNPVYQSYSEDYLESFYRFSDKKGRYRLGDLTGAGTRTGDSGKSWKDVDPTKKGRHWAVPNKVIEEQIGPLDKSLTVQEKLDLLDEHDLIYWPSKGTVPQLKRYLREEGGVAIADVITDINPISSQAQERLGYPTQKPKALLERIITASSNEGDTVLDAFCGCGTTIDSAEGLRRNWIGIDISPFALSLIKGRLKKTYAKGLSKFEVRGIPEDEPSALKLWQENPFAFQDWWVTEFEAFSSTFGIKGADKGVDGIALYAVDAKGKELRAAFQVKGGESVQSKDIDALLGAMQKHKCELGVFLTAAQPTKPMQETASKAGFVKVPGYEFPKVQILRPCVRKQSGEFIHDDIYCLYLWVHEVGDLHLLLHSPSDKEAPDQS